MAKFQPMALLPEGLPEQSTDPERQESSLHFEISSLITGKALFDFTGKVDLDEENPEYGYNAD
jgi:hypothetical protein